MFNKNEQYKILNKKMKTKNEIAKTAVRVIEDTTGLQVKYQDSAQNRPGTYDGMIEIRNREFVKRYAVQVKARINRPGVSLIRDQLDNQLEKCLLVTGYVAPQMADLLKQNDIAFIDAAGNAYINDSPLFLFVKGNKRPEEFETTPLKRAFKTGGLRIIFALLCHTDLIDRPFREIAHQAGVALGTVAGIINELKEMGYVIDMGERGRKLINREDLLRRWVVAYPEQLRPKLLAGKYQAEQKDWWETAGMDDQTCWGGEVAASILTGYLKPKRVTLYAKDRAPKIILKNRLTKNPAGDIEILTAFWNVETGYSERNIVHPILVYADLMATGDPRNIETAGIIYEKEIARFVGED